MDCMSMATAVSAIAVSTIAVSTIAVSTIPVAATAVSAMPVAAIAVSAVRKDMSCVPSYVSINCIMVRAMCIYMGVLVGVNSCTYCVMHSCWCGQDAYMVTKMVSAMVAAIISAMVTVS